MIIDTIYENKTLIRFIYSPLREMLCALHVLCNDKHHLHRKQWAEKIDKKIDDDLKKDILECGSITNEYTIIMDFEECDDLNISSSIEYMEDMVLYKVRKIFERYNKKITAKQYKQIIATLKKFYIQVFIKEEKFIEPVMIRLLKRKASFAREHGILQLIDSIHERIELSEDKITFYKHKQIEVNISDLNKINIYVSTFIGPHLLLGYGRDFLELTILLEYEKYSEDVPEDLVNSLSALGDATRIRILKEISKEGKSTQELSRILCISEAAVSKALKLLFKSNIVYKQRKGNYIIYKLNKIEIDYLPYKIYEYILR